MVCKQIFYKTELALQISMCLSYAPNQLLNLFFTIQVRRNVQFLIPQAAVERSADPSSGKSPDITVE